MAYVNCIKYWPNVSINRNETTLQIFTGYFNKIDRNRVKLFIEMQQEIEKSQNVSNKFNILGKKHYSEKNYVKAMSSYTVSIAYAPHDSVEFGLSIASRSAVLFVLKKYKECLVDIDRVFKTEYPKNMLYKIFIRQAKCFVELKLHGKASEAIQNAKRNFETTKVELAKKDKDDVAKKINEVEQILENNLNIGQKIDDEEQPSLPALTGGENPQFAYASSTVSMKKNKRRGRHVVATVDIKKGDVLFVEEPYSAGMFIARGGCFIYCSNCFTSSVTCIPCLTCTILFFCSDACRQQNWNAKHRWECSSTRRNLISIDQSLVLGILFQASRTGFNTVLPDKHGHGNKQDNYPYVNLLLTHKNDIPYNFYMIYVKVATFLVIYLIHFTDYFDWLYAQENRPNVSRDKLYRMVGGFLIKYISQIDSNGEQIMDTCVVLNDKGDIELSGDIIAYALYVSSALMNHSCMPNALKSFHGSTKIVTALKDIKKGTEITINYLIIESPAMLNLTRIKELKDKYYFTCTCRICTDESSLMPWLCPRCQGRALTTSDNTTAKCAHCQHTFCLDPYRVISLTTLNQEDMYLAPNLANTLKVFKQIYHKTNPSFWATYFNLSTDSRSKGNFKQSLKYMDLAIDVYNTIFGDTVSQCILYMALERCLILVHYSLALKAKNPSLYSDVEKQTKEAINKSVELLKHHTRQEHIDTYQQNMLNILNAGDSNFNKTKLVFHGDLLNFV